MLLYVRGEFDTLTKAVQHHRSHSSYLFADLHQGSSLVESDAASDGDTSEEPSPKCNRVTSEDTRADKSQGPLEKLALNGQTVCTFYNTWGCNKGEDCSFAHYCNYPGCNKKHARAQNHKKTW